jgi:hypothetical protein
LLLLLLLLLLLQGAEEDIWKRDNVTEEWRKLNNEELRDLYSSPSIIRIIKSRRMRWAGHVARMEEKGNAYRLLLLLLISLIIIIIILLLLLLLVQ